MRSVTMRQLSLLGLSLLIAECDGRTGQTSDADPRHNQVGGTAPRGISTPKSSDPTKSAETTKARSGSGGAETGLNGSLQDSRTGGQAGSGGKETAPNDDLQAEERSGSGGARSAIDDAPKSTGAGAQPGSGGAKGVLGDSGISGSAGWTVDAGTTSAAGLRPSSRNPKYHSQAPPLAAPLPQAEPGTWVWLEVAGALSRDGSPAGFYYKYSTTGDKSLVIYLVGGGACQDYFFCNNNPPNKNVSLTAESYVAGATNLLGPDDAPQDPTLAKWQTGIFKNDASNPVKDWNMVFIPYVTGDVFAGDHPDATVAGYPSPGEEVKLQFVGRANMIKFLGRIIPTFSDAPIVLLTGSSAGGLGALMSYSLVADGFIDQKRGTTVFVVDDSGPMFDDEYTPACLQQRYREYFGLDSTLPKDCAGCFSQAGGGISKGYLEYILDKYPDHLLGGLIDSDNDEIMQLFYSDGYNDCDPDNDPPVTYLLTTLDSEWAARYREGLIDLVNNHMKRMSSYLWAGSLHQNFFETSPGVDRYYSDNGLEMTPAEWLAELLKGRELHLGTQ